MDKKEQIRDRLKQMAKQHGPLNTVLATVTSVDEAEGTCELDDDGLALYDVRLKPVLSADEAVITVPAVGSWVLVARIEEDEDWLLLACEKVEKYRVTVGAFKLELSADGFEISNDQTSLKSILTNLVSEVVKIYAAKNVGALQLISQNIENLFK